MPGITRAFALMKGASLAPSQALPMSKLPATSTRSIRGYFSGLLPEVGAAKKVGDISKRCLPSSSFSLLSTSSLKSRNAGLLSNAGRHFLKARVPRFQCMALTAEEDGSRLEGLQDTREEDSGQATREDSSQGVGAKDDSPQASREDSSRTKEDSPQATQADLGKKENGSDADQVEKVTSDAAKAHSPVERRRRGPLPDLLTVKGIGPRNMEKLVAKGIGKLVELKQLYRDKFRTGGTEKLVEYLVDSVGVHKNHANVIASFIREAVEKEITSESSEIPKPKKRLTFCVEGNISVGKTTFLQRIANETIELRDLVEVVPEPVGKWQDVGKDHFNVLDAFYAEPTRYAYTFQNYVFVTRLMQERESANGLKPLRLMERSVFSDRMVFVRAVHEAKWMSEMEISIYDSWFDPVVAELPGLVPDGFIYLRASPDACHRRLQMRKRPEEEKVTRDYLQGLHEKHEQWLFPSTRGTGSVLSLKEWPSRLYQPPTRIKDRVFYLEGDNVHSCIKKVPALVLDCEASIDFSKDVEAKAEYARQVADFFEYVKQTRDGSDDGPVVGTDSNNVLLPRSCCSGILGPDGLLLRH